MLGEWVFVLMCWLYMATLLRLLFGGRDGRQ